MNIELPPFEEKCIYCSGTGSIPYTYQSKQKKKVKTVHSTTTCNECKGRGRRLTEAGKAIIDLVTEWSPFAQDFDNLRDDIRELREWE